MDSVLFNHSIRLRISLAELQFGNKTMSWDLFMQERGNGRIVIERLSKIYHIRIGNDELIMNAFFHA